MRLDPAPPKPLLKQEGLQLAEASFRDKMQLNGLRVFGSLGFIWRHLSDHCMTIAFCLLSILNCNQLGEAKSNAVADAVTRL